jgi:hypothetical protein
MANMTITNNDLGQIELDGGKFRRDTLLFAAADTWAAGTILARKLVSDTITAEITGTGVWDLVAAANAYRTLQVGPYVITAGTLSSGVGPWTAVAPDGQHETFTSSAADDDLEFPNLGFTITVTTPGGGATDFATSDVITMTTTAQTGSPLVPYDVDGTNGAQVPVAVLTYEQAATGGGSVSADALVAGEVNKTRLVIDADGDASNVDDAVLDLLKASGIVATDVKQLSALDTQD